MLVSPKDKATTPAIEEPSQWQAAGSGGAKELAEGVKLEKEAWEVVRKEGTGSEAAV